MKKILVVVDMQNDFVYGSLGTSEAQKVSLKVEEKVLQYRTDKIDIVFTRDTHGENYLETQEGKKLPVVHCVKNSMGWEIIDSLKIFADKIFDKPTFGSVELAEYIKENNFSHIEIVGLCTDICVVSNALLIKAFLPDADVIVDTSCCAGVTKESHDAALKTMEMCQITLV